MLWLQSRTLHLTKYSKPLQRMLCEANAKLPVLTLFTKHPCSLCEEAKVMLEPHKHKAIAPHWRIASLVHIYVKLLKEFIRSFETGYDLYADDAHLQFILQEIDITLPDHSVWLEKYKYEIPVFHLNGKFLMKHRVDIQKLENQLLNLELQDESNK